MQIEYALENLRRAIQELESERKNWARQIGLPESAMNLGDVRFMDHQITKLVKAEARLVVQLQKAGILIEDVRRSIERHIREHPG